MAGNQGKDLNRLYQVEIYIYAMIPHVAWRSVWDSNPRHGLLSRTTVFKTAPFIHSGNAPDVDTVRRLKHCIHLYITGREEKWPL